MASTAIPPPAGGPVSMMTNAQPGAEDLSR